MKVLVVDVVVGTALDVARLLEARALPAMCGVGVAGIAERAGAVLDFA